MKTIVLASGNNGKIREIQNILGSDRVTLKPQSEWGFVEAEETGSTFIENAIIKARHAAERTGLPALADDSGLVVDALFGSPGVYSARFAGQHGRFDDHMAKVLELMKEIKDNQRTAYFYSVIVYIEHAKDPCPQIYEGRWDGLIAHEPSGDQGFGYDPIFYIPEYACTAAEMDPALKNSISHRAKALASMDYSTLLA